MSIQNGTQPGTRTARSRHRDNPRAGQQKPEPASLPAKPASLPAEPAVLRAKLASPWRPWLFVPVAIVCGVCGVAFFFFQQNRAGEAKKAMSAPPVAIDGERAYRYLKQICEIGPRSCRVRGQCPPAEAGSRSLRQDGRQGQGTALSGQAPIDRKARRDGQPDRLLAARAQPADRDRRSLRHPASPRRRDRPRSPQPPFPGCQ